MDMKIGKILALAVIAVGATTAAANASCEGRKTTGTVLGAGGGGLLGSAVTHGSAVGVIGGAVVGGVAGHEIAANGCHRRYHHAAYYYDRYHHKHYYHTATR
jgi:osmotically inducible lipoprotein OsmB